jgi:hypothetical protein
MSGPADRRGGWRIEFGQGTPRRGGGGGPRGPRGPLRPTGGGGDGEGDDPRGPLRPPVSRRAQLIILGVLGVLLLLVAIFLRPLLHAPLMWFWKAPLPWFAAAIVLIVGRLLVRRQKLTVADLQAGRYPGRGTWATSLAVAAVVFFFLQAVNPLFVNSSIAKHTVYKPVVGLPETGIVRLVPREVAEQVLTGSFNSSTEQLLQPRIINTPEGLQWSALRTPLGLVRRYSKKGEGLVLLDAEDTIRTSKQVDADFTYAPGLAIFDSLTWQLRKKKLLVDLSAPVGILDAAGKPLILVPYVKYVGFPFRRPELGGAFLVHPDGRIEDLSPAEARKRPEIVESGRLVPDTLARREQDAYAFKNGIWNYLFLHTDQTKIVDTETNSQPYLLQSPGGKTTWVSVAEPHGVASATSAVFLTDSTTGINSVWKVPGNKALTGNARALKAARSLTIPGVTFTSTDRIATGSGGFRAIEPRPVFIKGKLYFLISIIPDGANNVSKTVIIDADTNQSVGVFDGDNAEGLQQTLDFLQNGPADTGDDAENDLGGTTPTSTTPGATTPRPSTGTGKLPTTAELRRRVEAAIKRQSQVLDDLKSIQEDLGTTP